MLPASCKRGKHSLAEVGYKATVQDAVLNLSCQACAAEPHPDHFWVLGLEGDPPARAELDDEPYRGVTPRFIVKPVAASTA